MPAAMISSASLESGQGSSSDSLGAGFQLSHRFCAANCLTPYPVICECLGKYIRVVIVGTFMDLIGGIAAQMHDQAPVV